MGNLKGLFEGEGDDLLQKTNRIEIQLKNASILIIEDSEEEREKAATAFSDTDDVICFAQDYEEGSYALFHIKSKNLSVKQVLADLYFPRNIGSSPEPYGIEIAVKAKKMGLAVVICTDGHHHRTGAWAWSLARELSVPFVEEKDWALAKSMLSQK